jgi:predicted transposase/invertase (TIGR01784 family)
MGRLKLLNDYLFQKLLGEKGDEEQLLSFLNAVLKRTERDCLTSVEILENKIFSPEIIGNKTSIFDVRATTNKGDKINIEVQLKDLHNQDKRSLMYWSREYVKDIESGDDYKTLPNVITINIVNFDYVPLQSYHTSFHLREDKTPDYILTESLEIHFINMMKFRALEKKDIKDNLLERWLSFLDETTSLEVIEEIKKMDVAIQKTAEKLDFVSKDKESLRLYHLREMAMSDWTTAINTANEKGIETGKVLAYKEMGIPIHQIAEKTGLTVQEIENI